MTRRNAWISLALLVLVVVGAGSGSAAARSKITVSSALGGAPLVQGMSLSGSVVWTASADVAQIRRIDFRIDGDRVWSEQESPYVFNGDTGKLDTTTLANGTHTLAVKVTARNGQQASLDAVVQVTNDQAKKPPPPPPPPPPTQLTVGSSIASGAALSGSVAWSAVPSGGSVSKVEFLIDATVRWTDQSAPYVFNGDGNSLDTTTLTNGSHVLAVKAYGTTGQQATASSTVSVANATGTGAPPAVSTVPADVPRFGISLGGKSLFRSAADRAFELDQIQAVANGHPAVVRIDSDPGNQQWLDQWVAEALPRKLEPLLILFGTTKPVTADEAASFAAAQGAKWKGKIRLYEFTNEPDLNGWTPEQYTADLKAAYVALKKADPNAILVAGALWKWDAGSTANASGGAREWVRRMYADGAKGYFDVLSLHFYDDPDDHGAWNLWDQAFTTGPSIRSIMDANGDSSIPIFSTESGGPTDKYGEDGQATIIDHDFNHLYSGQIRMMLAYTMLNDDVPGFGLLRDDRTRRPAWNTFQRRTA